MRAFWFPLVSAREAREIQVRDGEDLWAALETFMPAGCDLEIKLGRRVSFYRQRNCEEENKCLAKRGISVGGNLLVVVSDAWTGTKADVYSDVFSMYKDKECIDSPDEFRPWSSENVRPTTRLLLEAVLS
jgi:hypothetical protein